MVDNNDWKEKSQGGYGGSRSSFDDGSLVTEDDKDMYRMGKKQELKRNFQALPLLGMVCILITTWSAMIIGSTFSLINGGRAGTIWTYLGTWIFQIPVTLSLAEMASMAPTAGGQYHWVSEFADPRAQKFLSYMSGWLAALGWQAFIAGSAYNAAVVILLIASLGNPSYQPTQWQETLLTIFVGLCAVFTSAFGAKVMPIIERMLIFLYVAGFLAMAAPLWALAPKASATTVFTEFSNYGGWSSVGAACLVGSTGAFTSFIGVDSAAHMAEEVKHASRAVPRMMLLTIVINGVFGLAMVITYVFAIQNIETQILGSTSPFPFIGVVADAVGIPGAIGMSVPVAMMFFFTCMNAVIAGSRQAWSFARDDGMPFPRWFSRVVVVNGAPQPLNATIASLVVLIIIALLNLASTQVPNSIFGLIGSAVGSTYAISIGCVLWRRLFGAPLPPARFSMGRLGVLVNGVAFFYQVLATVMSFFPLFTPVPATQMNWSIAVFGGVALIGIANYALSARKRYRGPVVKIIKD